MNLTIEQQYNALKDAINILLKEHPEYKEEHSTGWDMLQILAYMEREKAKELIDLV